MRGHGLAQAGGVLRFRKRPTSDSETNPEQGDLRFRALAETAPDAIITIDTDSVIQSVNPATERIFGWTAEEMIGQPLTLIMPERLRTAHSHGMARYLKTGERHIPWTSVPLPACTRDGREISIEVSFGEFQHEGQRVFSGFLRDVTDRVNERRLLQDTRAQLEATLVSLEERVAEAEAARQAADVANAAKSQFLATMSHELRTPLNAIAGYVELLETELRGPLTEPQRADLARVRKAQGRLLALINDVLNFARLDAGHVEFMLRDVDVAGMACALGTLVEPQVTAKRLRYECDAGEPGVIVCADEQKLEQILLNLLSNAVKFTPEGGTVTVSVEADPLEVHIRVRDTGVGIPADRHAVVFEPFVQVDSTLSRAHEGTGLGLSISRELAIAMGGRITLESEEGSGSVFTLTLPRGGPSATRGQPLRNSLGATLTRDALRVVQRLAERLRADSDTPDVSESELEDHLPALLTDLGQLLQILDGGQPGVVPLVEDSTRIQDVIVRLHAAQRRRLGWSRTLFAREFDALAEESANALRRDASLGRGDGVEDTIALMQVLLDDAKSRGLRAFADAQSPA